MRLRSASTSSTGRSPHSSRPARWVLNRPLNPPGITRRSRAWSRQMVRVGRR